MRLRGAVFIAAVCAATGWLSVPAGAAPTLSGVIAFSASVATGKSCHRDGSADCDLYLGDIDLVSGRISHAVLVDGADSAQWYPAISPDGRLLAYNDASGNRNRVIVLDLPGLTTRQIINDARFPAFSADSRRMFYSTTGSSIRALDVATRQSATLTPTAGTDPFPIGDRYLAFHVEEGTDGVAVPFVLDLTTGVETRLPCTQPCGHVNANPARNTISASSPATTRLWVSTLSAPAQWSPFAVRVDDVSAAIAGQDPTFAGAAAMFLGSISWPAENVVVATAEAAQRSTGTRPFTTTRGRLFLMDLSSATPVLTAVTMEGYPAAQTSTADVLVGRTLTSLLGRPTASLDRLALNFSATSTGTAFAAQTSAQQVRLTQNGTGPVDWTAGSDQPWITVSPSSGSGSAVLNIGTRFVAGLPAVSTGSVTIMLTGSANQVTPVAITLTIVPSTSSVAPVGSFDTPLDGATGLSGSIAVSGWALDDVEVTELQIWRDPNPSDPAGAIFGGGAPQGGKVFVGQASFVDGARPDVQVANPASPLNSRAGWGYLMLTRGLIWDGKGPFKLYAIAADREGHLAQLGARTMTVNNAGSTRPFGAIDTPGQGATATGIYPNTGWVLTPNAGATIPAANVAVAIDGAFVPGVPSVSDRADISAGFPAFTTSGAGRGLFIDTTQYAGGVHTIGWLVTDSTGNADGVGSRFFTIANGSATTIDRAVLMTRRDLDALRPDAGRVAGRRGFDRDQPFEPLEADGGRIALAAEELDRIELRFEDGTGVRYTGYLRVGDRLAPLPIGSRVDGSTFTWQPGPGFLGAFDLVFVRLHEGVAVTRHDVRVTIRPQGTYTRSHVLLETPAAGEVQGPMTLAGWAVDAAAPRGSGLSGVHCWAYPVSGAAPIFLGIARLDVPRLDVAAVHGEAGRSSGFEITTAALAAGTYDVAVFAWSEGRGQFLPAAVTRVTVR